MQADNAPTPTPYAEAEELVRHWGGEHLHAVIVKSYARKFEEAQQLLDHARAELAKADLPEDVREALSYHIDFMQNHLTFSPDGNQWRPEEYEHLRRRFETPARTAYGNLERVRRLLVIRFYAEGDGFDELTQAEIEGMLSQLPVLSDEITIWHSVARWAFRHRNLRLMERAFETHLTNPSAMLGQAKFQRVNLMHLLVSGRAVRRDVEETIKLLAIKPQLVEFVHEIWPACVRAGITDDALEELLQQRAREIEAESPEPKLERKTKSLRGGAIPPED